MNKPDPALRREARELLIKAKLYRIMALVFAVAGLCVFMVLYFKNIDGRVMEALHRPLLIGLLLIPFLPAIILARIADKSKKKLLKLLEKPSADK